MSKPVVHKTDPQTLKYMLVILHWYCKQLHYYYLAMHSCTNQGKFMFLFNIYKGILSSLRVNTGEMYHMVKKDAGDSISYCRAVVGEIPIHLHVTLYSLHILS